jgi:hypothetical protein
MFTIMEERGTNCEQLIRYHGLLPNRENQNPILYVGIYYNANLILDVATFINYFMNFR